MPSRHSVSTGLEAVLRFLSDRALPHVEEVVLGGLRRSIHADGRTGVVSISISGDSVTVESGDREIASVADLAVRSVLDSDVDTSSMRSVLGRDPHLGPVVREHPDMRIPGSFDATETAIRAVIGQQVSVAGANTIAGRLVDRVGERLSELTGAITHLFPTADRIADAELVGLGMPTARIATIKTLATAIAHGAVDLRPGATETRDELLSLKGVGEWTASYITMRVSRDRDAFLAGDLGVRKGAARLGLPTTPKELEAYSARWRPFRSYAVMYLWCAAR